MIYYKLHQDNRRNASKPGAWYARAIHQRMTFDEFIAHMHNHHSVFGEANIRGVLIEMLNCLRELLLDGKAVELGDLGIFRIGVKSEGIDNLAQFNSRLAVKGARLNLYLGKRFRAKDLYRDMKMNETPKNNVGMEEESEEATGNG